MDFDRAGARWDIFFILFFGVIRRFLMLFCRVPLRFVLASVVYSACVHHSDAVVVKKGFHPTKDSYSAFGGRLSAGLCLVPSPDCVLLLGFERPIIRVELYKQ
jgi:hypothetical protein